MKIIFVSVNSDPFRDLSDGAHQRTHLLLSAFAKVSQVDVCAFVNTAESISNVNMDINYVVDSNILEVKMMRLVEKYVDACPDFVRSWNAFADKHLLARSVRLKFFRNLGDENLAYLAEQYHGNAKHSVIKSSQQQEFQL